MYHVNDVRTTNYMYETWPT